MSNLIVVADADALIALALEKDPNHKNAVAISKMLFARGVTVIFPVTVFPEAITSLRRAANQPEKARIINKQLQQGAFRIEYIDDQILLKAAQIFESAFSKQNTFFDAKIGRASCRERV